MSMKNSSDTTGNRTGDLPTCSALPQLIAPPRAHCVPIRHIDVCGCWAALKQRGSIAGHTVSVVRVLVMCSAVQCRRWCCSLRYIDSYWIFLLHISVRLKAISSVPYVYFSSLASVVHCSFLLRHFLKENCKSACWLRHIGPPVRPSVCLSVRPSVSLSVCLSVHPSACIDSTHNGRRFTKGYVGAFHLHL